VCHIERWFKVIGYLVVGIILQKQIYKQDVWYNVPTFGTCSVCCVCALSWRLFYLWNRVLFLESYYFWYLQIFSWAPRRWFLSLFTEDSMKIIYFLKMWYI
jgi:hypothetical protein